MIPHPCLMLMTESHDNLATVVKRALDGGVNVVLWRDGRAKIGKRDPALASMIAATHERALLIADGNWETLVRLGLRRVHLPARSAPVGVVKFRIGNGALVGKSVDAPEAAIRAEAGGANYVVIGDGFRPEDGADAGGTPLGLVRDVCGAVHISVIATACVTPENTADYILAGAAGVAVSSAILQAADPRRAAAEFRTTLDAAWKHRKDA